jgi:hypothetical protein
VNLNCVFVAKQTYSMLLIAARSRGDSCIGIRRRDHANPAGASWVEPSCTPNYTASFVLRLVFRKCTVDSIKLLCYDENHRLDSDMRSIE